MNRAKRFRAWIKQLLCAHDWRMSFYVNIATGENLGSICIKCRKVSKP